MDAIELRTEDHRTVQGLFDRFDTHFPEEAEPPGNLVTDAVAAVLDRIRDTSPI